MRKSFTRFLGVLMLFCAFGLQAAFAVGPTWDGTKSIPKDGITSIKPGDISTQFVLAFSDTPAITAVGGTMAVYKGGSLIKVIPINQSSANVSVVEKTLVVKHGISSFDENANYTITLTPGAITLGKDAIAVSIAQNEYDFGIGDFTGPKLETATNDLKPLQPVGTGTPANMTINGNVNAFKLTMIFNEDVQKGAGKIGIYNLAGTVIELIDVATLANGNLGKTVEIPVSAAARFVENTAYYVKVEKGAFVDRAKDLNRAENNNDYAGINDLTSWTFKTRLNTAPVITASVTDVNATSAKLHVQISEAGKVYYKVQPKADPDPASDNYNGFSVASDDLGANTEKIVDLNGLAGGVEYEVFVVSENKLNPANKSGADKKVVTFTTVDNAGPVTFNESHPAQDYMVYSEGRGLITKDKKTTGLYIYFNEPVKGGTGTLSVREQVTNELAVSIAASEVAANCVKVTDDNDPWKGKYRLVLNFASPLASDKDYYIVFPIGYIKDMVGNNYVDANNGGAGHFLVPVNYTDWTFTSADYTAPVAKFSTTTKATLTNTNITGALLDDNIFITFDEGINFISGNPVDFGSWSKIVALQKDGVTVDAAFSYVAQVITIDPVAALSSNTTYTVILRPGAVKDASDNVLTAEQKITVTTGDLDNLAAQFGPNGKLGEYTPLTIKFTKDVRYITTKKVAPTADVFEALTNDNVENTFTLKKSTDNGATFPTTIDKADYTTTYDAAKRTITIVPVSGKGFASSKAESGDNVQYSLSLVADKIEDNSGNDLAVTAKNYAVNDYKKPVATLIDGEYLKVGDLLTVKFDEVVSKVATLGNDVAQVVLKLVDAEGQNVAFTASLDGTGKIYTLTPVGLTEGKTYYYGIGTSMQDGAGNVNASVYKTFKYVDPASITPWVNALTYTVNAGTAYPIDPVKPEDEIITGVAKKSATDEFVYIKVNFNVPVHKKVAGPGIVTIAGLGDIPINNTDISGSVLSFKFKASDLFPAIDPGTPYDITIPKFLVESNDLKADGSDFAQMPGDVVITFKSKDTKAPTFTNEVVSDPALVGPQAMNAKVLINFDEEVVPQMGKTIKFQFGGTPTVAETVTISTSNVVLVDAEASKTLYEIKHADFLQHGTTYTVVVAKDAFKDLAGNTLGANDVSFTFQTIANIAPAIAVLNGGILNLSPRDNADLVPMAIDLNMVFTEDVVNASDIAGTRKLIYVIEKNSDPAKVNRASINAATGDLTLGDDTQQAYAYADDINKVFYSGASVTVKGVTLKANKEYYVLITPGAFKDKSLPNSAVFAGINDPTIWNFTTSDTEAPSVAVEFTKLGADGLVATNSDIKLTFNKPIAKFNASQTVIPITNNDLPTLFQLKKGGVNIEFTGRILNENVVIIDNSSLVILDEMKPNTQYTVSFDASVIEGKVSGMGIGAFSKSFWTTDAAKPAKPVITFNGNDEVNAISWNNNDGHVVKLNVAVSDVNSQIADHTKIKTYWLKSSTDVSISGSDVKNLAENNKVMDNAGNFAVEYKGGMTSKTDYFVYAVSEDVAGNLSDVAKLKFTTDDVEKPVRAGALPTSFDKDGNLVLVFNEPVDAVANAKARVIDAAGVTYEMPLTDLNLANNADGNKISIKGGAFTQMLGKSAASFTIEIDPGMIVDVPRQVNGTNVNNVNSWDGISGTSFVVTTPDQKAPTFVEVTVPAAGDLNKVSANQAFTLKFSEGVNLKDFTQFEIFEGANAFDVVTAENISGLGTNLITITPNRALASGKNYKMVITNKKFVDLSGNLWDNGANVDILYTAADVAPLSASSFQVLANALYTLPIENPLASLPTELTINFSEPFFVNPNDGAVNSFELKANLFVKADGTDVPFEIEKNGNSIKFYGIDFTKLKGKTITYGFINLYDANDNVNAGQTATFKIAADAVNVLMVTFVPGENKSPEKTTNITVDQTFEIDFNGLIYTWDVDAVDNNLNMTLAYLKDKNVFSLSNLPGGATLNVLSLDVVNGKHVVKVKSSKTLADNVEYILTINNDLIQVGQENVVALNGQYEKFKTGDVTAPKLVSDNDGKPLASSYKPLNAGTIAKDQTLALEFTEPVVGVGLAEIRRWDGVLVATFDLAGKKGNKDGVANNADDNILELVKLSDLMTDANPLFVTNTKYYVIIPNGSITDKSANAFAGITGINGWWFDLRDDRHPVATFVDNGKVEFNVHGDISLTFDRAVSAGAGYLAIYTEDGNAVQLLRNPGTGAANVTSYVIDINQLQPNTKYLLELGEGSFVLAADNTTAQTGIEKGVWSFSTEVQAAPKDLAWVPANTNPMVTGVALNSDLVVTFDQKVIPGTGNIQLHKKQVSGGPIITNFNVSDATKVVFDGYTVTVPAAILGLTENSEYYVIIDNTAIKNTTPTPEFFKGITVPFSWNFKTGDFTAPTVTATPANGNKMPLTFDVTLTFNEKVTGVSATTLTVSKGTINSVSTEATGTIYVANITAPSLADVVLTVPATIKDMSGNALAATTFTYKVDNFDAPALVSWTPADESKAIAKDTSLVMTFSKPVVPGTGKINVYNSLNQLFKAYAVTAENVSDNTVTIPVTGLESQMTYVVTFEANTVKDVLGLPVAAFNDPTKWNFTVADFTAPKVVNVTPANASNATRTFDVVIEFSEDVVGVKENITVSKGTVVVKGAGKVYIASITGMDGDEITMTIGKDITDAVKKNKLEAEVTKTYTIGDYTAPTVVVTDPAAPVATVFTVGLAFNEPVTGVADAITVTGGKLDDVSGNGKNYVLTVSAKEQTSVSIVLGNTIKDISPNTNAFAGQTLTYKTGDFTAPALVTKTPTLDNTLSDTHPTFKMTFNEDVKLGAGGSLKVYKVATTIAALDIPLTAAMINGKEITVNYNTVTPGLERGTRYYVKVDGSAITDAAGNAFVGVSDAAAWTFKTGANWPTEIVPNMSLEFKVYPNPFVDFVNVANASQLSKIVVTNIAGQVVKEIVNPTDRIQLNELRTGAYFISMYDMDNVIAKTVKIVKR